MLNEHPGRPRSPENGAAPLTTAFRTHRQLARVLIQLAGNDMHALYDTATFDNCMHFRYFSKVQLKKLKRCEGHADLAADYVSMKVIGGIDLDYTIQGEAMSSKFLISEEMRNAMLLEISWNEEQDVIYNHPLQCIYAGKATRILIYLIDRLCGSISSNLDLTQIGTDFPSEFRVLFKNLIQLHYRAFCEEGHLPHTRSISQKSISQI